MWIFGYGSLMWDDWEKCYGCTRKVTAQLPGFRRVLNKASVKNWGTKENPGPTLNIENDESGSCQGVAFEFPKERWDAVLSELSVREGGFDLEEKDIVLPDGNREIAIVPIYKSKNIITGKSIQEYAEMIRRASGSKGRCVNYVQNLVAKLSELDIADEVVTEIKRILDQNVIDYLGPSRNHT